MASGIWNHGSTSSTLPTSGGPIGMSSPPALRIEGARQNNLKNVSLEIPHDRLTVVTGVSGSGKSSLAFDTLFAEAQWRYIESLSTYARMFLDRVDRPDVDRIDHVRPGVALEQKNPVRTFAEAFRCSGCGAPLERPQPLLFSFNHPLGACPECKGFGNVLKYDEALVVPDRTLSLAGGAVEPWTHPSGRWYQRQLLKAAKRRGIDATRPWDALGEPERAFVYEGDGKFPGINGFFEEIESYRYKLHVRVFLSRYRSQSPCPVCRGARLKAPALAVRVAGMTIAEFTGLTIESAAAVLRELKLTAWEAA